MRKSVLVLAVVAAGLSSAAVAKDLKQEHKAVVAGQVQGKATVSGPARMSDADMDKVTAGDYYVNTYRQGSDNNSQLPGQAENGFRGQNYHGADFYCCR